MEVRDLSLPLFGAEDTPLTPSGGGTSAVVGGDERGRDSIKSQQSNMGRGEEGSS